MRQLTLELYFSLLASVSNLLLYIFLLSCLLIIFVSSSLHLQNLGFDIANYPNAYAHFANEISLPLHTCLTDEDVEYVIEQYKDVLKEYIK